VDVNGVITTVMGTLDSPFYVNTAIGTKMALQNPRHLAIDEVRGFLYVSDTGHHRIVRLNFQTGIAEVVAGVNGAGDTAGGYLATESALYNPGKLKVEANGNLIIVDSGNNKIKRVNFSNPGNGTTLFASKSEIRPGVRKDANGSWIASLYRNSDGTFTRYYRDGRVAYFNSQGKQMWIRDRHGLEISYQYDADGNLISMVDPQGRAINYGYTAGKLVSIQDPGRSASTRLAYDFSGRLTSVTHPSGAVQQFFYDADGLMTQELTVTGQPIFYNLTSGAGW
jgi:YD repeat-containing protein